MTYSSNSVSQSGPLSFARNYGLPVISTDIGEIGYYIKKYNVGFTTKNQSSDDLSNEIHKFVSLNNLELNVIKENILNLKEKYSWINASKNYDHIISDFINKKNTL